LFGNHAASMGFLIAQAQKATDDFKAALHVPEQPTTSGLAAPAAPAGPTASGASK
jgi:hypothetical protein